MKPAHTWQSIQAEVRRRIHSREWTPGDLIPNEADLAREFGCARATVNRALQSLAEAGFLDRKRRAGTRVALRPVAKATLDIALLRSEIEARQLRYEYRLLSCQTREVPDSLKPKFKSAPQLHVTALHLGNGAPYVVEDRWINRDIAPDIEVFEDTSPNEWLLLNAPYSHGEIAFLADVAGDQAAALATAPDTSTFKIRRATWDEDQIITYVELTFAPGYQIQTTL